MKNQLGKVAVEHIALCFSELDTDFKQAEFCQQALLGLDALELKQRVSHIIRVLHEFLPVDFAQATNLLKQLPTVWQKCDPNKEVSSFAAWPVIDYASVYGLAHPQQSLDLLSTLTHLFSAEFAIRAFIIEHPEYCHSQFTLWIKDDSEHVRRLVSEGTRPRLPWGLQLKNYMVDPSPNIPLLAALKDDPSLYVRRSVANHLNDISKDNPEKLLEICHDWHVNASNEVQWIIKHATRSLVKAGHSQVLSLLGYQQQLSLAPVSLCISNDHVQLGEYLEFDFEICSTSGESQKLVIDFAIHFVKANGQQNAKVFKLKSIDLAAKQSCKIQKRHGIKAITTRQYYAGTHRLEILVNGQGLASQEFELNI
ncbi:DNA alkylation repair protein [Paraglaciecola sp.]|uniref:DNA alkylation repair protein n=1 Tax=Paraglaciecola sp. TaxID=1920173 RepID=UPI0030F39DB9